MFLLKFNTTCYIIRDEFNSTVLQLLVGHEEDLSPENISAMFHTIDLNDDEHIQFEEFRGWFMTIMHTSSTASTSAEYSEQELLLAKELAAMFVLVRRQAM